MIAGVAGGLGRYLGVDPVIIRVAFVVLAVSGGSGLLLYLIGMVAIPEERPGEDPHDAPPGDQRTGVMILGGVLIVAGGLLLADRIVPNLITLLGPLVLIGLGAAVVVGAAAMTAASTPSRHGGIRWSQLVWGGALLVFGIAWFVDVASGVSVSYAVVAAATLIAVGVALPIAPAGDRGGVFGLGLVLTLAVLASTIVGPAVDPTVLRRGMGDVVVRPTDATELQERYEHGVGDVEVDLRALRVETPTAVVVDLAVGDLVVRVPPETAVEVDGDVGVGDIVVFGDQRGGVGPSVQRREGPSSETRVLHLDASVGIGRLEVTR